MASKRMWMVRAGQGAYLFDDFKDKGIVAIGWDEIGDLSHVSTPEEIKHLVDEKYAADKKGKRNISSGQIKRFRFDFREGDYVVTYSPEKRIYMVGKIIGEYEYNTDLIENYPHIRKVKWLGDVERDKLSVSTKNTLGAISTIFEMSESAKNEILSVLKGNEGPRDSVETAEDELDSIKEDMIEKAHEFIKDKISSLSWEDMEELVAGILRGMGYKTMLPSKGPDRGRDIFASPDGLGLEDPRIVVEVKHRNGSMGAPEIRSFLGGLRSMQGNKGLYVSTGGFTKEAKYEAERADVPLTLIDLDMLAKLVVQYYDNFDEQTKALIPLVKIYWLA